jgi:hypothetical protein
MICVLLGSIFLTATAKEGPMNPVQYLIANPGPNGAREQSHRGDFFEIYGPETKSQYSEVFWSPQTTPLPADIVSKYHGKTIAVTGYEVDIVRQDAHGNEEHVPCYEQYNHHYTGFMHGSSVAMVHPETDSDVEQLTKKLAEEGKLGMSHGMPLPYFVPLTACNFTGVWLDKANGISVNVLESGVESGWSGACMGGKGWSDGKGAILAPTAAHPQGGATSNHDGAGYFESSSSGMVCAVIAWSKGQTWYRSGELSPTPAPAPAAVGIPHAQAFSEGNGNEHRQSFKGYPNKYAQLIHSPSAFSNSPMIINTNKRLTDDKSPGFVNNVLLPRHSLAPPNATYSGILECPCTTRKPKVASLTSAFTSYICLHILHLP